jgi:hypothetical protein
MALWLNRQEVPDNYDTRLPGWDTSSPTEPISDQEEVGCCVAECWKNVKSWQNANDSNGVWTELSVDFIYDVGRQDNGQCPSSGMESIWGPQVLAKYGDCYESDMPFKNDEQCRTPSQQAYTDAKGFMVGNVIQCQSVDDMYQAILQYGRIGIGIPVYESITTVGSDGMIPMPGPNDSPVGGHELCVCGWLTINGVRYFIVKNSWWIVHGVQVWGDYGYGYLQEQYMINCFAATDPSLQGDSYCAVDQPSSGPPPPPPPPPPAPTCEEQYTECIQAADGDLWQMIICVVKNFICKVNPGWTFDTSTKGSTNTLTLYDELGEVRYKTKVTISKPSGGEKEWISVRNADENSKRTPLSVMLAD